MCRMIARGIGIGVLPDTAARPHVASMRLARVRLQEPWATRRMLLGNRGLETLAPPARDLAQAIMTHGGARV